MRKLWAWLLTAGTMCLLTAVLYGLAQWKMGCQADAAVEAAAVYLAAQIPSAEAGVPEGAGAEDEQPPETKAEAPPLEAGTVADPIAALQGEGWLGLLEIPALGRDLPVQDDWDEARLKRSPCRYAGDLTGGLVIAGHNYRSHFSGLPWLALGEEIRFTDLTGKSYHYQVAAIQTLDSAAVEEMTAGDWDLTLFTCTPGGTARTAVRCTMQDIIG